MKSSSSGTFRVCWFPFGAGFNIVFGCDDFFLNIIFATKFFCKLQGKKLWITLTQVYSDNARFNFTTRQFPHRELAYMPSAFRRVVLPQSASNSGTDSAPLHRPSFFEMDDCNSATVQLIWFQNKASNWFNNFKPRTWPPTSNYHDFRCTGLQDWAFNFSSSKPRNPSFLQNINRFPAQFVCNLSRCECSQLNDF